MESWRIIMSEDRKKIVIYGTSWCPDCHRSRQFLGEQRIHYVWVDIDQDADAADYVQRLNNGKRIVPTIVFSDGEKLTEPSNAELAQKLGIVTKASKTYYDVVIVGGGAAGLTAALYLAREGVDTLVIEKSVPGGQAGVTQLIENLPGFDEGISGAEFARRLTRQSKRFGVEVLQAAGVKDIRVNGKYREVYSDDGNCYVASAVLIATGSHYRRLNVPGEEDLIGVNIHFCATCDGAFYKDKDVLVIGGGNSGFQEGLFLTKFARNVTIVEYLPEVKASAVLQHKAASRSQMKVVTNHAVQEFLVEDGQLAGIRVQDRGTGSIQDWQADGVFIFVGLSPNSDFLPNEIERDRYGFIMTNKTLESSMPGVFAAGDVRAGSTAQIAAAAGEGATAALMIREYLSDLSG
jgi:thioredoxin reductase (NADPH)